MAKRIRYKKTKYSHVIESLNKYQHPSDGSRYLIRIDKKELRYYVIEDNSEIIVATAGATSPHKLKLKAKKILESLGISFEDESREANV